MRRILLMVRKDLKRQLRSPMGILLALSFPIFFTSIIALAFGSGSQPKIPKVQLLVEDLDDSLLSGALVSATGNEQVAKYFDVRQVGPVGREMLERGAASALWRIPKGFQQAMLDGTPVQFELIRNPAQSILPEIAEQGLTVLVELLSSASRALREPLDRLRPMIDADAAPTARQVSEIAVVVYDTINRSEKLLMPPAITLASVQLTDEEGETQTSGSSSSLLFLMVLPGISVWGLFLVGDLAMRDLITEIRLGTLRRQLCGPLPAGQLVVGKAVFTAMLSLLSLVVLATVGWIVGRQSVDLIGFVSLSLSLVLAITGYAALVYGGAGSERQGATISSVLLLVFAFLGGSFVQIDSLPSSIQRVAPVSPFYWGTTGYQKLIRDGAGLTDLLPNIGVLAVFGVVLLAAGSALLQRKVRRGTA